MVSFIIYFHSSRADNLQQCLRLLARRDPDLMGGQLVLVCQDRCYVDSPFTDTTRIDLGMDSYLKPAMCNLGVREAKHDTIVLLDSDRVLPYGYFTDAVSSFQPGTAVTVDKLYRLLRPYDDSDIDHNAVQFDSDFRSKTLESRRKNLFAGNTLMSRRDYLACGGMDESFVGYGYADTDMSRNVISKSIEPVYLPGRELHLFHPNNLEWAGEIVDRSVWKILSCTNALRYLKKWKLPMDQVIRELVREVESTPASFPPDLWWKFVEMRGIKW